MFGIAKLNNISMMLSNPVGWVITNTASTGGSTAVSTASTVDPSGNIYYAYLTTNATLIGTVDLIVMKIANDSSVTWKYRFGIASTASTITGIFANTSNVYISSSSTVYIINNAGTFVATRATTGSGLRDQFSPFVVDSTSSIIYASGYSQNVTTEAWITKMSSAYVHTWSKQVGSSAYADTIPRVLIDSSDNVYLTFNNTTGSNPIIKYNSAGTQQFSITPSTIISPIGHSISSTNDIIFSGYSSTVLYFVKLSSAGTITWQKSVTGITATTNFDTTTDSSGNHYFVSRSSGTSYIIKTDSTGTKLWERTLTITAPTNSSISHSYGWSMKTTSDGLIVDFGNSVLGSASYPILFKLPLDGTGTGTYTIGPYTFSYTASTLTTLTTVTTITTSTYTSSFSTTTAATISTPTSLTRTTSVPANSSGYIG